MPARPPRLARRALLALLLAAAGCGRDEAAPAGRDTPAPPAGSLPDGLASDELFAATDGAGPGRPPGRWLPARAKAPSDPETVARIAELLAIGYAAGSRAAQDLPGATCPDPSRVQPGLNLLVSGHAPEAVLMDSAGRILHAWRRTCREAFPDLPEADAPRFHFFRRAHLQPDGSLLAIFEDDPSCGPHCASWPCPSCCWP